MRLSLNCVFLIGDKKINKLNKHQSEAEGQSWLICKEALTLTTGRMSGVAGQDRASTLKYGEIYLRVINIYLFILY